MFCPVCKSEYREGFTKCSDCGAALVKSLPEKSRAAGETDSSATELLWSGDSSLTASIIGEFLEAEKIPFDDEEVEFGKLRQSGPSVFKVWIQPSDHTAAKQSLNEALRYIEQQDKLEEAREAAEESTAAKPEAEGNEPYNLETFDPEQAADPVWSGSDSDMKDMVIASLRELGIGSLAAEAEGKFTIRVEPSAEKRAKEIVREIVEQTPPE
ncbi:MAG: hypothetical protein WCC03_19425 [Candidatus Acidiferrales bacterium]